MQPPFNFKLYLKFNSYLRFETVWFNFTDLLVCFSSISIKRLNSFSLLVPNNVDMYEFIKASSIPEVITCVFSYKGFIKPLSSSYTNSMLLHDIKNKNTKIPKNFFTRSPSLLFYQAHIFLF